MRVRQLYEGNLWAIQVVAAQLDHFCDSRAPQRIFAASWLPVLAGRLGRDVEFRIEEVELDAAIEWVTRFVCGSGVEHFASGAFHARFTSLEEERDASPSTSKVSSGKALVRGVGPFHVQRDSDTPQHLLQPPSHDTHNCPPRMLKSFTVHALGSLMGECGRVLAFRGLGIGAPLG